MSVDQRAGLQPARIAGCWQVPRAPGHYNTKQQAFLDFVLSHYVQVGVEELGTEKLTPLLRLRYHDSIADALADLGRPDEISRLFAGFQQYLYMQAA